MRFGVESVKHNTPEENILQYINRFSYPTTTTINDGIEKRWPMDNPNAPPQKKYLFDIKRPWLSYIKPKNTMKWRKFLFRIFLSNSFSNLLKIAPVSKKALKILRLKRVGYNSGFPMGLSIPTRLPSSNLESSGRMYLRNLSTEKRALKIIRLKKNTDKEDNENVESTPKGKPNYVSVMNPTGQFRFGRSDPEFGKDQCGKRNLDDHDDQDATLENDIGLYSRFY